MPSMIHPRVRSSNNIYFPSPPPAALRERERERSAADILASFLPSSTEAYVAFLSLSLSHRRVTLRIEAWPTSLHSTPFSPPCQRERERGRPLLLESSPRRPLAPPKRQRAASPRSLACSPHSRLASQATRSTVLVVVYL